MSEPIEIVDVPPEHGPPLALSDELRAMACPAGRPWTGDDPAADHGHTRCWLLHRAADEIERLHSLLDMQSTLREVYLSHFRAHDEALAEALVAALRMSEADQ